MSGWFPRFSPDALFVASGHTDITITGPGFTKVLPDGIGPVWVGLRTILFGSQATDALMRYTIGDAAATQVGGATSIGGNLIAAANGRWVIFRADPPRIIFDNGQVLAGYGNPAISDDATNFAYVEYSTGRIFVNGQPLANFPGDNLNLRWGSQTLCWERLQRIYGITTPGQPVIDLTIPGLHQYKPVPCWTGTRLVVLSHTDTGVILQQWGQSTGWPVYDGETDGYQDVRALDPDHVVVAFSVKGVLHTETMDLTQPAVSLVPPPVLADQPFTVDPAGVIADVWPRLVTSCTATNTDGTIAWFWKQGEYPTWGAWLDCDATTIGLLADSSMGLTQTTDGGYTLISNPSQMPAWMYFGDTRTWLPRRAVSGWQTTYQTRFVWDNGSQTLETVRIRVDVGHGVYKGIAVDLRHVYDPRRPDPKNPKRMTGYIEYSYWNASGQVRWEAWQDDQNGVPQLVQQTQPIPNANGSYETPPRPVPYGSIVAGIPKSSLTIVEYSPKIGVEPLTVTVKGAITGGSFNSLTWLYRKVGAVSWQVAGVTGPDALVQTFTLDAGTWELKLHGDGPGGAAETGLQRIVTVQPKVEVHPLMTSLTCFDGVHVLTAEDGGGPIDTIVAGRPAGQVNATRTAVQAWEQFTVEPVDGGVAFKSANGFYMSGQPDGTVVCNRQLVGAWETWAPVPMPDGAVAFKLMDGSDPSRYLTAEGGGGEIVTVRDPQGGDHSPGIWQAFTASVPLGGSGVSVIAGRIRSVGRLLYNDAGVFRPRFDMWGAILAPGNDYRPRVQWAARWGFNGGRVFCSSIDWAGMTAAQARDRLKEFLDFTLSEGMYVELTLVTNSAAEHYDVRGHVQACMAIAAVYPHVVAEVANEPYHQTQNSDVHDWGYLKSLADIVSAYGVCVALGTTADDEDVIGSSAYPNANSYVTRHLNRGMASLGRDRWNMIRRVRELENGSEALNRFVWNDEPIGAGPVDQPEKRLTDPAVFFCMGALCRGFEIGMTFMNESGLHGALPSDAELLCAQAAVQGFTCYGGNEILTFKNTGWADSPLAGANFDHTVVRAYSFVANNHGMLVLVGLSGDPGLAFQHGWGLRDMISESISVPEHGGDGKRCQVWRISQ